MADRRAFDSYLRSLESERLQDIVALLEGYEDQFRPEHVVPTIIVLLNLLPQLPERPRGMFGFGTTMVVGRVVYRLIRMLKEPDTIEAAVREILPQVATLSSKLELITDVGHSEGAGHKLVTEAAASQFEKGWRDEVRAASTDVLSEESELLRVFLLAKREAGPEESLLNIADSPRITLALLRSARREVRSQSVGSRAIRRSDRLSWDALVELCGDENTVRERIEKLKASQEGGKDELLQLEDKYVDGWRPDNFRDD